ncbi:MAG: primosomal protein N', partial [Thiohalospira sp.]
MAEPVLRVAVPSPVRRLFDYLPPAGEDPAWMAPGMRVRVPFGRRRVVGTIAALADTSDLPAAKLRRAEAVLDGRPLLTADTLALLHRAADYYHHPPGEVFAAALPGRLR